MTIAPLLQVRGYLDSALYLDVLPLLPGDRSGRGRHMGFYGFANETRQVTLPPAAATLPLSPLSPLYQNQAVSLVSYLTCVPPT